MNPPDEASRTFDDVLMLRATEVARLLKLSRSQVYAMMGDGRLPVIRVGRAVRVPREALNEWVRRRLVEDNP